MGNSASVPEEERAPEERGSSSSDGSCRELSSGGSSFNRAAIIGVAAGDSSNRSPPERGSRSIDGSCRKLPSSSRELSKEGGSLKRAAIDGGAPGDTSNGSPSERVSRSGDGSSHKLSSSSCELSSEGGSLKRAAIGEGAPGDTSNDSLPKRRRGSSSSSIYEGSSRRGSTSSSSRGRQKKSVVGRASNSVPESGKRVGGSGTSASSSSKTKAAGVSKKPAAKEKEKGLDSGFDIIACKIRSGIYRLAGLSEIEKKTPNTIVRACQSAATKTINSNFQESTGKATKRAPTPTVSSSASFKATRSTTSIDPPSNVTKTPFAEAGGDSTFSHIQFSLADRGTDIVEPHKELMPSTQTLTYERLLPEDIARLDVGDELIIQVPQSPLPRMEKREKADHKLILTKLEKVMLSLFGQSWVAFERELQLKIEKNARSISVVGVPYYEFSCRIRSYAERFSLSAPNPDKSAIDGLWSGGSGIYVEMCGYSPSQSLLIMHRMMPFVKIFKLRTSGSILNEPALKFPEGANPDNMAIPLARKLALVAGDSMKALEVLMRYYKELNRKAKRAVSNQAAKAAKASSTEKQPDELMAELLLAELEETKLREFARRVEELYRDATVKLYSNFTPLKSYLVSRSDIADLYEEMKTKFPTAHAMLGILVSSQNRPVEVAPLFEQKKKERKRSGDTSIEALLMQSDDDSDYEPENDVQDDEEFVLRELESEDVSALQNETEFDQLSAKEQAVLHLFLSALKLKNQKHMVIWSALAPMANWACGHKQDRKKPSTSVSCDSRTAWSNLNRIADECMARRENLIRSQKTMTCTFDNCQEVVPKKDQTEGKSAVTLRGTSMFLKRDKVFDVPVDTEMVSSLGIRFKVVRCARQDPFTVVIKGTLLSSIGDDASDEMKDQANQIEKYNIFWPQVGWEIISMPGTEEHIAPTYDRDQFIPAPIRFRIPDGMVLQGCEFAREGEGSKFTVRQYTNGVELAQSIISINEFKNHLNRLRTRESAEKADWDERQEELPADQRELYVSDYAGIIRDASKEALFVDTIGRCSKAMGKVYKFQSDCVNQMNPTAHEKDQFIVPEVIPREEGSNTGMLMTSLSLHEQCQLIKKAPRGEFTLRDGANSRDVIMHGDALSVRNYRALYMKITQKLTRFGNEGLVDTLLAALDSVTILPGLFHEDMHRLDCVYRIFYPGCWQAMQFVLGIKRVNGDPVKGNFQDHENFALKLLKAFRRHRFRCFLSSQSETELVPKEDETPEQTITRIEKRLRQYCEEWESSPHEPSRVIALSIKCLESYSRCRDGTRRKDVVLREQEGCDWLAAMRYCGKTNYVTEICERIERLYGEEMKPWLLEVIRCNNIAVLTDRGRGMAQDEVNELVNAWLKVPPSTPSLEMLVKRSAHLIFARAASMEIHGKGRSYSSGRASEEKDILHLEKFLCVCGIFKDHSPNEMSKKSFWSHTSKRSGVGSNKDKKKETVEYTEHEQNVYDRLVSTESQAFDLHVPSKEPSKEEDTADDMNSVASVASSVINTEADVVEARDVDPEQSAEATSWESLTDDQRVEEAAKTLKTVGMGKIQDFNDKALSCMFTEGFKLLKKKNIIKSRKDAKMKRERQIKFIHCAVRFFQARMKKRREQLKKCTEASQNKTYVRMNRPHEVEYRNIMKKKRTGG